MGDVPLALKRLRDFNAAIRTSDAGLAEESADLGLLNEIARGPSDLRQEIVEESIILRRHRPVLRVIRDTTELKFSEGEDSAIWTDRLVAAKDKIDAAIEAVGRINLVGGILDWVGTGWLVRKDIIVTNRHVAEVFSSADEATLAFVTGVARGDVEAKIDFLEEFDRADRREFRLLKPIYVAPRDKPDIAFFEVEQISGDHRTSEPIVLASSPRETNNAATLGYPAFDSRIPDTELMEEIYGRHYNKKRLAPGAVTHIDEVRVLHNCTTLGGNSGSAVIDLESGKALGLHFSGAFLQTNYAVRADIVSRTLDDILKGARPSPLPLPKRMPTEGAGQTPTARKAPMGGGALVATMPAGATSLTIPLTITVSLGTPEAPRGIALSPPSTILSSGAVNDLESQPEDYEDRGGYVPDFISGTETNECPLPVVSRDSADVLSFDFLGRRQTELKYQNFSVVMSFSRRLCFFSAVNVDAANVTRVGRGPWKWDPRIPRERQVMNECYGDPPKFSRGHMTRRQDPSWGPMAAVGNRDSMHVTNATPQMQAFNSPIWLELEDYALENAIDDGMRLSVFTGPFFRPDDPDYNGVKVPVSFWKIIAFRHDHTGRLCATGYRMSQKPALPPRTEEEFVFGGLVSSHTGLTTQVSISEIAQESGIDFGPLAAFDPVAAEVESTGPEPGGRPILAASQIRYF